MSSFWWNFHHWLHRKLSKWQLSVQPVTKISSKWWHFRFSGRLDCQYDGKVILCVTAINPMRPCDAIWWDGTWATLVNSPVQHLKQCLFSIRHLGRSKYNNFPPVNFIWKCHLQNSGHFVKASTCQTNLSRSGGKEPVDFFVCDWRLRVNGKYYREIRWLIPLRIIRCGCIDDWWLMHQLDISHRVRFVKFNRSICTVKTTKCILHETSP